MVETTNSSSRNHSSSHSNVIIPASSLSVKSVLLHSWWLVKNPNNRISVAGLASRERPGRREFVSAPISRRIDTSTLETSDGIIITISGLINRSQTLQNGFPFSVCNHFELGFPFDWEELAAQCEDEESAKMRVSNEKSILNELKNNFDNLPATRISDIFRHMSEESFKIFVSDHITGKVADEAVQHSGEAAKSEADKTPWKSKRVKSGLTSNNDDETTISKNLNSKCLRKQKQRKVVSTPEEKKSNGPEVVCAVKASSKQEREFEGAGDESSVRRSGRLKIHKSYVGMAN